MTSEEKSEWGRLNDALSRSEFVTKFWAARDPKPETPENEYRTEYERRVAFSDANFTEGNARQHDGPRDDLHPARAADLRGPQASAHG